MTFVLHVIGMQLLAWALGLSVTVVLLDSSPGLVRDHPPLAWRLAGLAPAPMAMLSLGCSLLARGPLWLSLALVLPFALMATCWAWSWHCRAAAPLRRRRGQETLIIGLLSLLFVSLAQSAGLDAPVLALAASAGSAALVGGTGILLLGTALGRGQDEVATATNLGGIPLRVVATGLGITLMAALDTGFNLLLRGDRLVNLPLGLWVGCSLMVPLTLLAVGQRLLPRWQPSLWATSFGAVLIGQVALQTALYTA